MFRLGDKVLARALVQGHEPEGYGSHPWVLYKLVLVALLEALAGTGSAHGYDILEIKVEAHQDPEWDRRGPFYGILEGSQWWFFYTRCARSQEPF